MRRPTSTATTQRLQIERAKFAARAELPPGEPFVLDQRAAKLANSRCSRWLAGWPHARQARERVDNRSPSRREGKKHAVASFFPSLTGTTNIARIQRSMAKRRMKSTSVSDLLTGDHASKLVNAGLVRRDARGRRRLLLVSLEIDSRSTSTTIVAASICRSCR